MTSFVAESYAEPEAPHPPRQATPTPRERFGHDVETLRKKKGLDRRELAGRLGLATATVRNLELARGKGPNLTVTQLFAIERELEGKIEITTTMEWNEHTLVPELFRTGSVIRLRPR